MVRSGGRGSALCAVQEERTEESRGPGSHGREGRRVGWAVPPSPAKPAFSSFVRKEDEYAGRPPFYHSLLFVFFLLASHPSLQGRSGFCPSG